jgi:circadian clock protein KaiB
MKKFLLKLYVTGHTPRSEQAISNLRRICQQELAEECEVVIVDVLENPQQAEDHKIVVTPTLIRESPPPLRRIIGDLSNTEQVLQGLLSTTHAKL